MTVNLERGGAGLNDANKKLIANISETSGLLQNVDEAPDLPCKAHGDPPNIAGISHRGLAKGRVDPRIKDKRPCVIFGEAYPSWLAFVSQLGYRPVMVVLRSDRYLPLVEASVADDCTIWCFQDWTTLVAKLPHFDGRDAVTFIDGRVTQQVLDLSELMDVHVVLGTGLSRRHIRRWNQVVSKISHASVGGVTHTETHVVACSFQSVHTPSIIPAPSFPSHVPRDMSSVLSDVVGRGVARTAPKQRHLAMGAVINVRPMAVRPVYHGMGW